MVFTDDEVKRALAFGILHPTIDENGKITPVYARAVPQEDTEGVALANNIIKKYGAHSPNLVKTLAIGTDAAVKDLFVGNGVRCFFGKTECKLIEEVTSQVVCQERKAVSAILDCLQKYKFENLEGLFIDKQILYMAGISPKMLKSIPDENLVNAILSADFGQKLFGDRISLIERFPRIIAVGLGDRVFKFKGNWEQLNGKVVNRHWLVQEKLYVADEALYKYVMDYNKVNFGSIQG